MEQLKTEILGPYAHLVPHPDDTDEHKEKLQELAQEEENE